MSSQSRGGLAVYECGHFLLAEEAGVALPRLPAPATLPVTVTEVRAVLAAHRLPPPGPEGRNGTAARRLRVDRVKSAVEQVVTRVTADLHRELAELQTAWVELLKQTAGDR